MFGYQKLKTKDFYFDLPKNLIAQYPTAESGKSRLMLLDRKTGIRSHLMVEDLPEILLGSGLCEKGMPLLVFNNSKVRKARLFGKDLQTGAKAEFLLLENLKDNLWKALASHSKRRKPSSVYVFFDKDDNEINRVTQKVSVMEIR